MEKNNPKRIELPLGWKCNIDCFFCSEIFDFNVNKGKDFSFSKFSNLLLSAYKNGYNHLTIVGGEPTIEPDFFKAVKLAKKLGMGVQISTNCLRLYDEKFTKELLQYVDWLTLSIHTLDDEIYDKLVRKKVKNIKGILQKVFENINKYYNGNEIRINTVLTQYNYRSGQIEDILNFAEEKLNNITSYVITYPDIVAWDLMYKDLNNISIRMSDFKEEISNLDISENIKNKILFADMPFCGLPEKYRDNQEDKVYDRNNITKVNIVESGEEFHERGNILPRKREKIPACKLCKFDNICRGIPPFYQKIHDISEIIPIVGV